MSATYYPIAIDLLNKVKAWRDCDGNDGFPSDVREGIDALLMATELRQRDAALAHTGQAVDKDSLTAEAAPAGEVASELEDVLRRNGFVRCDLAACNCGSWHARYGLPERMAEIKEALSDAGHPLCNENGNLVLRALQTLIAERDALATPATEPAAPGYVSALQQASAALESCGAGAVEDGGAQWFDEKLVDAAHEAINEVLAAASTVQGKEKP